MGDKKSPFYRIVVCDSRKARDGAYIDQIGYYDPTTTPETIKIEPKKAKDWLSKGVIPTLTVKNLLIGGGVLPKSTKKSAPKTKTKKKKEK
jgi:small subunit ribosomal protein S16